MSMGFFPLDGQTTSQVVTPRDCPISIGIVDDSYGLSNAAFALVWDACLAMSATCCDVNRQHDDVLHVTKRQARRIADELDASMKAGDKRTMLLSRVYDEYVRDTRTNRRQYSDWTPDRDTAMSRARWTRFILREIRAIRNFARKHDGFTIE